jgi:hypothetical protein
MNASSTVDVPRRMVMQCWTLAAVVLLAIGLGGCCSVPPIERVEEVRIARDQLIEAGKGIKTCEILASGFAEPTKTELMKPINELSRLYDYEVGEFKKVCMISAQALRSEVPSNTGSLLGQYTREAPARFERLRAEARALETTINDRLKGGRSDSVEVGWGGLKVNPISLIGSMADWFEKREWKSQRPHREFIAIQLVEFARTTPTYAESSSK